MMSEPPPGTAGRDLPPAVNAPLFDDNVLPPRELGDYPPILAEEREEPPRTVGRPGGAGCSIQARFRVKLIDPRQRTPGNPTGGDVAALLFPEAQPELRLTSNGIIAIQVQVIAVAAFPGSLSFEFSRTAPGAANPHAPGPFASNDFASLKAQLDAQPQVEVPPPPNISANNSPVVETLKATVTWTPTGGQSCSISESVRLVWDFASVNAVFEFSTTPKIRHKTVVRTGKTIEPETYSDGSRRYAVATQIDWLVHNPNRCCDSDNTGHAVIQFVRHKVQLNEIPSKQVEDKWTLDIIDSEARRARDGNPYDPTFTRNPRTSPDPSPLVYPGPSAGGESAIEQVDKPGMDPALYQRFLNAGGRFTWQFYAFLVCVLTPGDAANYLAHGRVTQALGYRLDAVFPGGGKAPEVKGELFFAPVTYGRCKTLREVLDEIDRKNGTKPCGKMIDGYNEPRGHQVAVPH
jgi:hypothetical protein